MSEESKIIEVTVADLEQAETNVEQAVTTVTNYPSTAFSIAMDVDGLWKVVSLQYNLVTKEIGQMEVLYEAPNRQTAIEKFKIEVAKSNIMR